MENKTLTAGIIITFLVAMSGTYYVALDDDAYYCESRDIVMLCEKLSSGSGTRCYFENTYKKCNEGWQKIEVDQEINTNVPSIKPPQTSIEGIIWSCDTYGKCVRIE